VYRNVDKEITTTLCVITQNGAILKNDCCWFTFRLSNEVIVFTVTAVHLGQGYPASYSNSQHLIPPFLGANSSDNDSSLHALLHPPTYNRGVTGSSLQ